MTKRLKEETMSIRTSAEIKLLLRLAAAREHRSLASMIESLVISYAREHSLAVPTDSAETGQKVRHGTD